MQYRGPGAGQALHQRSGLPACPAASAKPHRHAPERTRLWRPEERYAANAELGGGAEKEQQPGALQVRELGQLGQQPALLFQAVAGARPDELLVADRHAQSNKPALCGRLVAAPNFLAELANAWWRGAAAGMIYARFAKVCSNPGLALNGGCDSIQLVAGTRRRCDDVDVVQEGCQKFPRLKLPCCCRQRVVLA